MEKSYETVQVGTSQIEIQVLQRTVIFTVDGKELDMTTSEAEQLYSTLGNMLGICHPENYYYLEEMTHMD